MAYTYFPFDSGAGANVTEQSWWKMARLWRTTGVIPKKPQSGGNAGLDPINGTDDFAVNPGTGLSVNVSPGAAWIEGQYFVSDSTVSKTLATADPTNPRYDLIVIRCDWVSNQITIEVLQGTPNASPQPPLPTKTPGSRYELPIAQVKVNAGATSIASTDITDLRVVSSHSSFVPACNLTASTNRTVGSGATVTLQWDTDKFDTTNMHDPYGSMTDRLWITEDGIYLVYAMIFWKNASTNVNGTCNFSIYKNSGGNVSQIARDTTYIGNVTQGVQSCMKLVDCLAGDYLYVQVTNNSSIPLDVDAATPYSPYFGAVKLGLLTGFTNV